MIDQSFTSSTLEFNVTSHSVDGTLHFGLYSSTNGIPTSLLLDFGSVTVSGTGNTQISFDPTTIPAGFYFLGYVLDNGSGSATFNVRIMTTSGYYSDSNTNSSGTYSFRVIGNSYTALPSSVAQADLTSFIFHMKVSLKP